MRRGIPCAYILHYTLPHTTADWFTRTACHTAHALPRCRTYRATTPLRTRGGLVCHRFCSSYTVWFILHTTRSPFTVWLRFVARHAAAISYYPFCADDVARYPAHATTHCTPTDSIVLLDAATHCHRYRGLYTFAFGLYGCPHLQFAPAVCTPHAFRTTHVCHFPVLPRDSRSGWFAITTHYALPTYAPPHTRSSAAYGYSIFFAYLRTDGLHTYTPARLRLHHLHLSISGCSLR